MTCTTMENLAEMLKDASASNFEQEEEVDTSLMTGLTEMLKTGSGATGNEVIFRPGTTSDVLLPEKPRAKKYWEPESDGNTYSTYTEEDFQRDFGEHEPNDDDVYESDPRQIADFRVVESEERTVEDSADAVCSFDVFGVRKKKSVVWKIQLKDEDPRTVDIDLRPDKFILYSHKYRLRGYFDKPVNVESAKTKFFTDEHRLEMRLRLI